MVELPADFPIVERSVVRVVVHDRAGRVLLFKTRDITAPELGEWWELPGGGIDDGESYLEAALRELREEAGIMASADQVGLPTWRRTASFRHRSSRRLNHEVVVAIALDELAPPISEEGRLDYEKEDYFDFRWWPVADIEASEGRFYPGRLPQLISAFLKGQEIDESFELWS